MGRSPCCDKLGLKKGPWTPEEDQKLLAYIEEHGHGSWRALPAKAGLQRCGKSCRLRWTNYLRPDIKRGKFSLQEEQTIIQLHALLGNRWSAIATHLHKRTDNEIKNYWNTHLKKRLAKMGIDPVTHKPKNDALLINDDRSKNAANLSHMAQWESARLEAEARLVRESKLRSYSANTFQHLGGGFSAVGSESIIMGSSSGNNSDAIKEEGGDHQQSEWKSMGRSAAAGELEAFEMNALPFVDVGVWDSNPEEPRGVRASMVADHEELGFTSLLMSQHEPVDPATLSDNGKESENSCSGSDHYYEDNKTYWSNILNLVNSSPSDSPMF